MHFSDLLFFIVSCLLLSLVVGSTGLWIWIAMQLKSGLRILNDRFRKPYGSVPLFAVMITLAYLLFAFYSMATAEQKPEYKLEKIHNMVNSSIVEGTIMTLFLGLIIFCSGLRAPDFYRLGFRFDNVLNQIKEGALSFVAAIVPVFLAILLTLPLRSVEQTHPFLRYLNDVDGFRSLLAVAFAAIVIAPLKEELMFRVILQNWLIQKIGVNWGIVITAVVFAAVHNLPDSLGLLPLAVILGVVYQKRRSFISVVVIHALFNAFNIGLVVLQKYALQVLKTSEMVSP